jgi:hypothetical protein
MGITVSFNPNSIDFGVVPPGAGVTPSTVSTQCGTLSAPVNVTAGITNDASGGAFTVSAVTSFVLEDTHLGGFVSVQKGESNGVTPLAVASGQYVVVTIEFKPTASTPDVCSATLLIQGNTWNPVSLPITATVSEIMLAPNATAVTSFAADRVDIFGLGTDNGMYHKAWNGSAWVPEPDWDALGGEFSSAPAVVSWGNNRLDIFALGTNNAMYHMEWTGGAWTPPPNGWEKLGGVFSSPPAVASYAANRLDVFARGTNNAMYHKAWNGSAWVPETDWDNLGGAFSSPPAVASWGNNRLDIFAIGTDNAMYHMAWAGGAWAPPPNGWENLGDAFNSPPAVASWGNNRLDIFGVGTDNAMYHKWWSGAWLPSQTGWEALGGGFNSTPAVASWGSNRLDVFGLGNNNAMYHKAWNGAAWLPSQTGWDALGDPFPARVFECAPAVASWGANNLTIVAIGTDNAMYYKAWIGSWWPSQTGWAPLGGVFNLPPTPTVPEPPGGYRGSGNYILANGSSCAPLTGVKATILFIEDLVWESTPAGERPGFSIQLNAETSNNQTLDWLQFVVHMGDNQGLWPWFNIWKGGSHPTKVWIQSVANPVATMPQAARIPAGYSVVIALQNDSEGRVTEATWNVLDGSGNSVGSVSYPLSTTDGGGVPPGDLSQIASFQVTFGGDYDGAHATFSSGKGMIILQADQPMNVDTSYPTCIGYKGGTGETSNMGYGALGAKPSRLFSQTFGVVPDTPQMRQAKPNARKLPASSVNLTALPVK